MAYMQGVAVMNIGDQVKLRSGGPAMTVTRLHPADPSIVIVSWFSEEGKIEHARLHTNTLTLCVADERALAHEESETQVETKPNI